MTTLSLLLALASLITLTYLNRAYGAVVSALIFIFWGWYSTSPDDMALFKFCLYSAVVIMVVFGVPALRKRLVSQPLMKIAKKSLPTMGETEKIALEAGTVWFDGEIFSGTPNWNKLMNTSFKPLTKEEQAFIEGPTTELCKMLDDWDVQQQRDLPEPVWKFIKENKFLGMIIPKEFGGLGFSALAHSEVITKVSSRSVTAGVTIMVPNSLGPGELLAHYGTKQQKDHYLPRLASGDDIPCFALTEPHAGSDAASMRSAGIVCKGTFNGKKVTGIKLNFSKRYITLAPIATVLGVAFKLYDPDNLLGKKKDIGITCALIPRETKGVTIGQRHDPMGVPFQNGPIQGKDVFIPLDYIIGGPDFVGQGWRMLMEQLSAGRGISLPSLSVSAAQTAARGIGAYGVVREQFGLPIGKMEGVQEPAARVATHAYFMDSMRRFACGAVDAGEKPSVLSAISKAYMTDSMRSAVNDAMDIQGGAGICRGPQNIYAAPYQSVPIGITVEGANILSRSMIIFGQGAIRCHPYMQKMMIGLTDNKPEVFDRAFFGLLNNFSKNISRSFIYGLTGGSFITPPRKAGQHLKTYKRLTHLSTNFALLADIALLSLGGDLKRKESLSGRFSDALSWLMICSATLKRFIDDGEPAAQKPLLDWTMAYGFKQIEEALHGIVRNHPSRFMGLLAHALIFPTGRRFEWPSDKLTHEIARNLFNPTSQMRNMITSNVYVPTENIPGLGELEAAYNAIVDAQPIRKKIDKARSTGQIEKTDVPTMAKKAKEVGVITDKELKKILVAEDLRDKAVQVDSFAASTYKKMR